MLFLNNFSPIVPHLPFPQRLKKANLDGQFTNFLNMFKRIEVNIHFVDALAQMLNYVNFMKEIMSKKKKLDAYGIVSLSKGYSTILQ